MMSKNNRVPDGWLGCPKYAKNLIVQKFMPIKTPLSENFDGRLSPENRFYPEEIFSKADQKQVKFGLWIDLTNTDRYYAKEQIEQQGCSYQKLKCSGHGVMPSFGNVQRFMSLIDNFLRYNPSDCIVIHCTHGFNRTGFLIVSFLVERLKLNVIDAIKIFADLRPPGIYRHEYVKELYNRYGNIQDLRDLPEQPPWCKR